MAKALFLFTLISYQGFCATPQRTPDIGNLDHKLERFSETIEGRWKSDDQWNGLLCPGSSQYDVTLSFWVERIIADPEHKDSVLFTARARDFKSVALGSYRSAKTLCIRFNAGLNIEADDITVKARAKLVHDGMMTKIKVTILESNFGTIHIGQSSPDGFDPFVTQMVNAAFRHVWATRIGNWISERISETVN